MNNNKNLLNWTEEHNLYKEVVYICTLLKSLKEVTLLGLTNTFVFFTKMPQSVQQNTFWNIANHIFLSVYQPKDKPKLHLKCVLDLGETQLKCGESERLR